jgi:hypothetical protein
MRRLTAAGDRFGQARGLAQVLDAACEAFEEILAVIGDYEDASDALVVPLLLAATQAAKPSCSRRPCPPAAFTSMGWGRSWSGGARRTSSPRSPACANCSPPGWHTPPPPWLMGPTGPPARTPPATPGQSMPC